MIVDINLCIRGKKWYTAQVTMGSKKLCNVLDRGSVGVKVTFTVACISGVGEKGKV